MRMKGKGSRLEEGKFSEYFLKQELQLLIALVFSSIFVAVLIGVVLSMPQKKAFFTKNLVCPSNWTRFRDSCYYFETTKMRYDLAEVRCLEKGSTLFVADSMEEWQDDEKQPRWTTPGGMNVSEIDWLLNPSTSEMNGWSLIAKCVGYFHSSVISYAFFYYCGISFNSICERNATLLANIWDESDRGF
uniref:C-type lectin domain-containing protein n=1 Tax=Angiostrongylus cantonensis TaxID=6313 RepID=A0A0K0DI30_ANGCA